MLRIVALSLPPGALGLLGRFCTPEALVAMLVAITILLVLVVAQPGQEGTVVLEQMRLREAAQVLLLEAVRVIQGA